MPLGSAYGDGGPAVLPDGVILTSDPNNPAQLEVKEIFVSEATGKLVIIYNDKED